jgi:hypothetical protein
METRIQKLEEKVREIHERNARVEAEKAWETSWFRVGSIMVVTYVIATTALYAIGNDNPLRNALIPTLGYFLSTQSLPFVKSWWTSRYLSR